MPKVTDPALIERLERAASGQPAPPPPNPRAVEDPALIARLEAAATGTPTQAPYQPNEFERAWAGIKTGFVGVAAGVNQAMTGELAANPPTPSQMAYQQRGGFSAKVSGMYAPDSVEAAFSALPADAYAQSAEQSARAIAEWTNEWMQRNAPADPKYRDNLYSAIGSMAAIAGPAAVMTLLSGPKGAEMAAALIESAAEQGGVERELITRYGMSAADAHNKSLWVFGVNLPMNFMLDKGLFRALPGGELGKKLVSAKGAKAIAKVIAMDAGLSGLKEGTQEVAQEVVSTQALGEKQDLGNLAVAGSTGFLVGGLMTGAGAPMAAASARQEATQPSAAPAAPPPAGQTAPPPAGPPPAGQNPTTSEPLDSDLALPEGFDLFTEPEEPAGAPTAPVAAPEPPSPTVESPAAERPAEAVPEPAAAAEPAGSPASQAEAAPSNITTMPIETIATDPETFQVRSDKEGGGFDEDFVRNAVENFDEQAVNPIEVWLDPKTGKYTVIDGHHTLEILKRVGKKIATVKIFKGTRKQAIKASQERNDSRRANDPLARTAVVRGWREAGRTKKDIKAEASRLYGKDANTIIALSYLNPNGRVMETLRQFAGADQVEINKLLQMAKWIGTVRSADPKITDAHEQEMFDYLRTEIGKPGSDTETEFRKYIEGRIGGLGMFDYSQALNLRNAPSRSPAQAVYDAELAKAKREKKAAEDELKAKTAEYKGRPEAERVRLLKPYEDAVTIANREYMALATRGTEIANIRSSEGSLFKILPAQRRNFKAIAKKYIKRGSVTSMELEEGDVGPEAELVIQVAKRLGAEVAFFRAKPAKPGARVVGGVYNPDTGTIFLNLEAVDREPLLVIAMHELGHHMQYAHPEQWRDLYFVALDNVSASAKAVHEAMKDSMGYTPDQFAGELVSDLMEEAASRREFWEQLANKHPSAFANVVAKIRDIIAAIKTVFASNRQFKLSPHLKSIQRMDTAIANVMKEVAENVAAGQQKAPSAQMEMFKITRDGGKRLATFFSGGGTIEAALRRFTGVMAVEFVPEIQAQYNDAHGTSYEAASVLDITPQMVRDSGAQHFSASPVCKNFSKAKRSRNTTDIDIATAKATAAVIREAGVHTVTIENVQDYEGTEPYRIITEALDDAGYEWRVVLHNATDFGAAQSRKRLMIQATQEAELPPLPEMQEPGDWFPLVKDLLADAPRTTLAELENKAKWEIGRIREMAARGAIDMSKPIIMMGGSAGSTVASAANSGGPAPTLKASPNEVPRILMPDGTVYRVTPRMMARLMGLPDTYMVPSHPGFAKKVLGNGIHGAVTRALIQPLIDTAPGAPLEFKILPPKPTGRAVADRLKAERDGAKARIKARDRRWRDFPRVLYQKMVDRNTWHYVAMKKALKAAGIDVDKYDMAKNPHLVLQRMAAWTEKADLALRTAVLSWDGTRVLSDGLEVIIRKFNLAEAIDNGDFGLFLHAARMKAMHDVLGDDYFGPDTLPDGSPNPEYIAAEAEFNDYMEVYNHFGTAEWQDAATAMTEWSNAIMQRLLESGAISQEQYDGMVEKYDIYAPMYVLEREEENRTGAGTKPKPTAGRVTWQMDRLIPGQVRMDPVEGMIKNVYRIEFLAANNSAKLAAADFIADLHKKMTNRKGSVLPGYGQRVAPKVNPVTKYVGDLLKAAGLNDQQIQDLVDTGQVADLEAQAKMWVTSSYLENGVVALMRNGEVEYWQFEPDIYNVFASINDKASHQLMTYFTLQTRLLRAGAVLTPEFMARNQFRDFLSAGVLATHMVRNPVDAALLPIRIMRGLAHAIKKDDIWQQFIMSGAGQANLVALDQENLKKEVDQITREARTRSQRAGQAVRSPVKYIMHSHPVALLQAFSKLTENSTRLAVWEKTYNDAIAAGKSPANARAMAAIQAREASTDFGRAGEYGRVINRIIPFFNASIQGNDKLVRALIVDKGNRGATWLRGTMMVTLPSVLLWAINRDEEWYKEQPAWLKNHFWLFSVDGGRTILKLPKPFEIGMIFGSLPERFLDYAYGEDPKAVGRWADSFLKDVGILQPGSFGGPLISTLVEIEQNYDAYRDTPIVKGWMQDVVPREQYTANTSEFAKWLGERYPGGRLSPLMVDHFIRGSFGGLGSWGAEAASNIIMAAEPERREKRPASRLMFDQIPDWVPVLRGLVQTGPTSYTQDLDDLYDEFDRTREAVTTLRSFKSGGAPKDKYLQLYLERGVDLALNEAVSRGVEPIAKISQQIKFIQSVPPSVLDRAEKRRRIDELMDMRNTLVREFMKKYRTIDRDSIQAQVEASVGKVGREFDRTKGR